MSAPSLGDVDRARLDAGVFAELLVRQALWPHQLEVAQSAARYRVICAGRQVGKSRLLAILALHRAFAQAGALVLVVSAGEVAARRLLEEVASLAMSSPLLAGAVVDESAALLTLSNGSTVRSVPASMRQIRGWAVDLLIVDEAGFVEQEIWRAAEPSVIARPGSRIVLASSPWGGPDHHFRQLWTRGMAAPDPQVASWHWPSTMSPLVDQALLEEIREHEAPLYFAREYLAEWTDTSGQYFTPVELAVDGDGAALVAPGVVRASQTPAVAGVDWGFARDASALVVVAADGLWERPRYRVAWVDEQFGMPYSDFVDRVTAAVGAADDSLPGYGLRQISSEVNGVGAMPTQELQARVAQRAWTPVEAVSTTARLKEDAFGFLKLALQQGRFALPRHPSLLRQLAALEFTQTDAGGTRISVPERAGHDDCAMALALAVLPLMAGDLWGGGALAPLPPPRRFRPEFDAFKVVY